MLEIEKKEMVKAMTEETNDSTVSAYLGIAGNKICRKAYPFDPTVTEVPDQYHFLQVEIAVYLLNKRGAEFETSHNENGINRTYESADVPSSIMRSITPFCSTLG